MNKEQLFKWRTDRGLKQTELAKMAGISASYLSSLESGYSPFTKQADRKLSRVMELYDNAEDTTEPAPVHKTEEDEAWVEEQARVLAQLEEYQKALAIAESIQSPGKVIHVEKGVPVDMVNSPAHYADRQYEVIDVMKDTMPRERFIGYCEGTVIKYMMRWDKKANPAEDLDKAKWYLNKLIETIKEEK